MKKSISDCERELRNMVARFKTTDDTEEIDVTDEEAETLLHALALNKRGSLTLDLATLRCLLVFKDRHQRRAHILKWFRKP